MSPPPPPPPPPPPSRCNPLSSLIAIMRKTSKGSKASVKAEPPAAGEGGDVKAKAVNEMMERIKHGVVLRSVKSQESKRPAVKPPPVCEEKPQESAMEELKGILETVKRSPSRGSQEAGPAPSGKKDSELEVILRRRRNKAGEAGDERDGLMSHVSSSDSLNGPERTSSESGRDPEGPAGLSVPSDARAGPERRGSGPGPVVARRRSSESGKEPRGGSWQERRSCSSLNENESLSNGCVLSAAETCVQTNGVRPAEDGGANAEC